jgi:DNA-binding beta-propeller fold protein YncE
LSLRQSFILAAVALFASAQSLAQDVLTPEQKAETAAFRALIPTVPMLPADRIELQVSPAMALAGPSAVAADKAGNLYVIHRPADPAADPIVVVDSRGRFLRSWGKGLFAIPHGIKVDPAGDVWAVDAHASKVFKFTREGKKLLEIDVGDVPKPSQAFCGATDVAFGRAGHVFVSDGYCNGRVIEYAADGKKLHQWGRHGTGVGEFDNAHAIAIGPDGVVYVADRENDRLQWFDQDGKPLGQRAFGGKVFSVAIGPSGELYVGLQPRDVAYGTDSVVFRVDPKSGKILGRVGAFAHQLSVAPDGALLPGTRADSSAVLLFRPRK